MLYRHRPRMGGCSAARGLSASGARTSGWEHPCLLVLICVLAFGWNAFAQISHENHDWPVYGGSWENQHYSPLAQINKSNVKQLQVAWSYDKQEVGVLQTSPIEVNGGLDGISPTQKDFAPAPPTAHTKRKLDPRSPPTLPHP